MSTGFGNLEEQLKSPYKILMGKRDNKIVLYLEDCNVGMKNHLAESSVDVVVTSPPYNIGIEYNKRSVDCLGCGADTKKAFCVTKRYSLDKINSDKQVRCRRLP